MQVKFWKTVQEDPHQLFFGGKNDGMDFADCWDYDKVGDESEMNISICIYLSHICIYQDGG